jgi:hypothetical protein
MKYRIETRMGKKRCEGRPVKHIELAEAKFRQNLEMRDVTPPAEPEIVHAPDLIAPLEQAVAEVTTDESSPSRHQNSHEHIRSQVTAKDEVASP